VHAAQFYWHAPTDVQRRAAGELQSIFQLPRDSHLVIAGLTRQSICCVESRSLMDARVKPAHDEPIRMKPARKPALAPARGYMRFTIGFLFRRERETCLRPARR
jgi:hypothetical protein